MSISWIGVVRGELLHRYHLLEVFQVLPARRHATRRRVIRALADLEEAGTIASPHVAEAIQYRSLDRQLF